MTDNMLNILDGMSDKVVILTDMQAVIALIILPFFAWTKFNTWTQKEAKLNHSNPPRHFTNFNRYLGFSFLYILTVECIYITFLIAPGLFTVFAGYFGNPGVIDINSEAFTNNYPFGLLLFFVAIVPKISWFNSLEERLRLELHRSAFIPAEAEKYISRLMKSPALFQVDPEAISVKSVESTVRKDLQTSANFKMPSKDLAHKWFKLSFLLEKMEEWKDRENVQNYFYDCGQNFVFFKEQYEKLRHDLRSYCTYSKQIENEPLPSAKEYLEMRKTAIEEKVDELLYRSFSFICCGILATKKTLHGLRQEFGFFFLKPVMKDTPQVVVDIILKCVFLVIGCTFGITYIYYLFSPNTFKGGINQVLSWTIVVLFMEGFSILAGLVIYIGIAKRKAPVGQEGSTLVFGRLTDVSIGAFFGYLIGFLIIMMYAVQLGDDSLVNIAARIWPWPVIPATTSGFIIYYLYSLDVKRSRLKEAAYQFLATAVSGAFAYLFAIELNQQRPVDPGFLIYAILVCGAIGFSIGWTFPEEYRERRRAKLLAEDKSRDKRAFARLPLQNSGTLVAGDSMVPCTTLDLSVAGARVATEMAEDIGARVQLDLHDIGSLPAVVARKGEKDTYLHFSLDQTMKEKLAEYLGLQSDIPAYAVG